MRYDEVGLFWGRIAVLIHLLRVVRIESHLLIDIVILELDSS